nr:hypothetical protein [uncultured Anaerosporobacter sp.]
MNAEQVRKGLHKRKEILEYIVTYIQQHSYAPSYREIAEAVGLRSMSSVQNHIEVLKRMGMLETDEDNSVARALRVPGYAYVKVSELGRK